MTVERVAEFCHETNRRWCEMNGDFTYSSWYSTPQEIKDSVIHGVRFMICNPDATSEQSHNNWMKKKVEDGWVYGKNKNIILKKHPCMVPYEKLSAFEKMKDNLFKRTVQSFYEAYEDDLKLYCNKTA